MSDRVIALIAGESGAGKSFMIANLPCALIYDTDIGGGLSYAERRIQANKSERIEVGSYLELLQDLRQRERSGTLSRWYTVAIDHVSALQQEANLRHNPGHDRDYGRANEVASKEWRQIREFCRRKDFNIVCTGHMKGKWEQEKQIGMQVDGAKNMEGDFNVVLHLRRKSTGTYPSQAVVVKWRRDPEDERGQVPLIFDFTLDTFVQIDGTDSLRRERIPVQMATKEQLAEITKLLEVINLPHEDIDKVFKKFGATSWEELPSDTMSKVIARAKERALQAANGNGHK